MSIRFTRRIDEIRRVCFGTDPALEPGAEGLIECTAATLRPGKTWANVDVFEIRGLPQHDADALFTHAGQAEDSTILGPAVTLFLVAHGLVAIESGGERIEGAAEVVDTLCNEYPAQARAALAEAVYYLTVGGDLAARPFRAAHPAPSERADGAAVRAQV